MALVLKGTIMTKLLHCRCRFSGNLLCYLRPHVRDHGAPATWRRSAQPILSRVHSRKGPGNRSKLCSGWTG